LVAAAARRYDSAKPGKSAKGPMTIPARAVATTALLLLWPALFNGAPLIFSDTLDFPAMMLDPGGRPIRALGYGAFAGLPALLTGSFWPVVVMQALLTAWVVHAVLVTVMPALPLRLHALAGVAIAALTSAGWAASYVMPDALTAPGLLALLLMLGAARGARLAMAAALVALAAASHLTHVAMLLAATGAVAALRLAPWRRAVLAAAFVLTGAGAVIGANRLLSGHAEYVRGGEVFLAARLAGDGLLQRVLAARCPDPALPLLCAALPVMQRDADEFLWEGQSPLRPGGDFFAASAEMRIANAATIAAFWPDWVAASLARAARQALSVRAGDGLEQELMRIFAPRLAPLLGDGAARAALASRQLREELAGHPLTLVPVPAALLGLALAPLLLVLRRPARLLLTVVLAGYLANALAIGFGGSVHPRYAARLAWLLPLAAGAALAGTRFGAAAEGPQRGLHKAAILP
jgi:hypothetical protein